MLQRGADCDFQIQFTDNQKLLLKNFDLSYYCVWFNNKGNSKKKACLQNQFDLKWICKL